MFTSIVFHSDSMLGNVGSIQLALPSWASGAEDEDQLEGEEAIFSHGPFEIEAADQRFDNDFELE